MYEAYFHFQTPPFPAAPWVANYFPAQAIEGARQALIRIIERAEGPGLVVGPAGVGKSLLLRVVGEHFAPAYRVVLLSGTRIDTRRSLLQNILFELGLPYRGLDEGELRLTLIDALRPGDACPHGILLLVDEAHTLPLRLLDEMRMITNVVRDGQPRARLVLAGGPALEERFANPKLESFNQRIAARCYLQSLTRDETHQFVRAQLSWAGGDPDSLLSDDVIRAIYQASDGIPRLINQVCDHAFVMAQSQGLRRLTGALIQEAWADLQQLPPPWQQNTPETRSTSSTVIEFGQLEDDEELADDFRERLAADAASPSLPATSVEAGNDIPEFVNDIHSAVVCGTAGFEFGADWYEDLQSPEDLSPPPAANPFEDDFDEEVVVIDRDTAWELEAFRGRPRVSCEEGRHISAELKTVGQPGESSPTQVMSSDLAYDSLTVQPAFEFTTLNTTELAHMPQQLERAEQPCTIEMTELPEVDLDEEVECVPLPWTRGTLGDDRDVIIIEEDAPAVDELSSEARGPGKPRRMEYCELFAQLRRATN